VIEDASARQTRSMIRSLDAAPSDVRRQIIVSLGLVTDCRRRRRSTPDNPLAGRSAPPSRSRGVTVDASPA